MQCVVCEHTIQGEPHTCEECGEGPQCGECFQEHDGECPAAFDGGYEADPFEGDPAQWDD